MAEAKKCDRCGKLYEPYNKSKLYGIIGRKIYWRVSAFAFMIEDSEGYSIDGRHDLCPDCMKSLQKWFKDKECEENEI